jgi:hypothetical protein
MAVRQDVEAVLNVLPDESSVVDEAAAMGDDHDGSVISVKSVFDLSPPDSHMLLRLCKLV